MPRISPNARRALYEERREQILKAAVQVFGEKGYDRATISDIARKAGVAEGSIYNYFKNKGDLLVGIPQQIVKLPMHSIAPLLEQCSVRGAGPPEQVLEAIARNLVAIFHQNAHILRILVSTLPRLSATTREKYMNNVILYAMGILETYFKKQMDLGVFRRGHDPRLLAISFFGLLFPHVILREVMRVDADGRADYEQVIQQIVPLFLHGVLAEPERKT